MADVEIGSAPEHAVETTSGFPSTTLAVTQRRYGGPEVLSVTEVRTPTPHSGEVLLRVRAASVNARDWHIMRGEPRLARLADRDTFGLRGPRPRRGPRP